MGLNAYIQGFNSLESIDRAPGYFKYQHHSVADHSFRTAELAQMMGDIEEVIGKLFMKRVLTMIILSVLLVISRHRLSMQLHNYVR
ncbi:unnamed protein product [Lactobacillus johnsonii FI9785]|uniref:Uncharacterized protein n=1 Tax=Lactobacillus johnsonii (strain FI9785) TaxID=633699 RepID=D0R2X5_LACJF|nr:unnamed protein product [Lactobacillus johnsonii FI9785]